MKLTEEMKFVQNRLVEKAHPGLSLEEARKKENMRGAYTENGFLIVDTDLIYLKGGYNGIDYDDPEVQNIDYLSYPNYDDSGNLTGDVIKEEIIGLPPTLSRVLNGLSIEYNYIKGETNGIIYKGGQKGVNEYWSDRKDYICSRKLLNDDGGEMTLFEQSSETITAIAREMGYKSE